jgi:hypothetical protein
VVGAVAIRRWWLVQSQSVADISSLPVRNGVIHQHHRYVTPNSSTSNGIDGTYATPTESTENDLHTSVVVNNAGVSASETEARPYGGSSSVDEEDADQQPRVGALSTVLGSFSAK